jgi:uncharacterized repeat protein (TIGR01451 family)
MRVALVLAGCGGGGDGYDVLQPNGHDAQDAIDARAGNDASTLVIDASLDGSPSGADLSIEITGAPAPVAASSTLTYTIDVTNHGGLDAGGITVTLRLPPGNVAFQTAIGIGWTCSAAGQIVTCARDTLIVGPAPSIVVELTTPPVGGSISTTVTVESDTADPDDSNNDASVEALVLTPADLAITIADSPDPAAAGATLTYTISVANRGPRDATDLVVTNRLPEGNVLFLSASGIGWTCALAGQIVTCVRPSLIVGAAPSIAILIVTPGANGALVDEASVAASTTDLDLENNTASNTTNVVDSADLSITASESPNPVRIGTELTYTLSVANGGPTSATAVAVVDTLPDDTTLVSASGPGWSCTDDSGVVTCTMRSLDAASSAPAISIVATAPDAAGNIANTATVSSSTSDPDSANNTATTVTLANAFADLAVVVTDDTDSPDPIQGTTQPGCGSSDCVIYLIDVTNNSPDVATGITVVTVLPPNGRFFSVVGTGWVCPAPSSILTCTRTSLDSGAAPPIVLTWKAPSPGGFSIVVTSTVSGTSTDPNAANNMATQDTTVRP